MSLKEKIQSDLTEAVKRKEALRFSVLRLLLAAVLNREKEKRYKSGEEKESPLTDEETFEVIASEAKKRKEAAEEYQKSGRSDLADKEKKELEILQEYLPEQLSEQEIKNLVKDIIEKTGAKEQKDAGRVMAELMPRVKGRAEGALVFKLVKELLTSQGNNG